MKLDINSNYVRRPVAFVSALALVAVTVAPLLGRSPVAAVGQTTPRSIQMSNSVPSATSTSYKVSFTPTAGATTLGGIVVDFCSDTPIVGNTTCTAPAGFTIGTPTVAINSGLGGAGWATTSSTANTLFYTNGTPGAVTAGVPVVFTISTVTNPSTLGSFYARIVTFGTAAQATGQYTLAGATRAASFANQIDYGGVALATAYNVPVSATVMETLTFCVSNATPGAGCGSSVVQPGVVLGTGTPPTIDSLAVYDNTASATKSYMQLSTNALTGATVSMKSNWTCTGLSRDNGTTCGIAGNGTATPIAAGSGQFGLYVAAGSGGSGTLQAVGTYATAGTYYVGANVASTSVYGDPIANTNSLPCNSVTSQLNFAATAASTTPAGVYTANESLIATGTF